MQFKDKTAIVTGGTRGIGKGIALELAKNGCNVVFNYNKSADIADELCKEIQAMGVETASYQVDAGNFEDVKKMVAEVKDKFGTVNFLVNNAGITRDKLLAMMSETDWDDVINTNLKSAYNFCKNTVTLMMRKKFGRILNITSVSGVSGMPGQVNYSASKAGLIGLTKALAKEVGKININVNAIACGFIATDMTAGLPDEYKTKMTDLVPAKRFGTVDDVAKSAIFLLSDSSSYITGHVLHVDGGLSM